MTLPILDQLDQWEGVPSGPKLFAKLLELDARLVAKGFPAMSQWWRDVLAGFYRSKKRWLVLRVGRRGGKSSTLCRLAVVEVLYGQHDIPPGDIGYWAFISTVREEAEARLVTVKAILDAIGVAYRPTEHGIIIEGTNVGFKTYVATIAGVSGFTAIGVTADEVAKWKDKETGANPANQVLKSLRPCMATVPTSKGLLSSSPFSTLDAHAEAFDQGDTPAQMVAMAPTWEANPTITEEATRELEPDEPTRLREYGAIPMNSGTQYWFNADAIKACISDYAMPVTPEPGTIVTAGGDLGFISDSAALVIGHTMGEWKTAKFRVADLLEEQPKPGAPLMPGATVDKFAGRLKAHGVDTMMADGHYKMTVIEHFLTAKLNFLDAPSEVADPFVRLRVLIHGGRCHLPNHPRLLAQLKAVMWRPTANNAISIIQPRNSGGHGDIVSALVLAAFQQAGHVVPQPPGDTAEDIDQAMFEAAKRRQRVANRAKTGPWWNKA